MESLELLSLKKKRRTLVVERNNAKQRVNKYNKEIKLVDQQIDKLVKKNSKETKPITKYNQAESYKDKVLFLMRGERELTITELVDGIMKREKNLNREVVYATVQKNLLRLANELQIVKTGNYNSKYKMNLTKL